MSIRALIFGGVVLMVGLAGFLLLQTTSVSPAGLRVGKVQTASASCTGNGNGNDADCLPEFSARTVDGKTISSKDLAGKTVLVNFWATWCGPCVKEIPALERAQKTLESQGFVILGIATDGTDDSIRKFVKDHGMTYPVVRADASLDRVFGRPAVLPTSLLYGTDGRLKQQWTKALSDVDLEQALQ